MSAVAHAVAVKEQPSTILGFIDACANGCLYGWAWDTSRPSERLTVRLMQGEEAVATATADRRREDLEGNGIGDGAHAFEIPLPAGLTGEQVRIVAVASAGTTTELKPRPEGTPPSDSAAAEPEELRQLRRSQRLLYRNLQAAASGLAELRRAAEEEKSARSAMQQLAETDRAILSARTETLEVALARIDTLLRDHATKLEALAGRSADRIARVLAGAGLMLAAATLLIVWLR